MSEEWDKEMLKILVQSGWSAWHADAIMNGILPAETPGLVLIYDKKSGHITTQHWKLDESDYSGIIEPLSWMKNESYDGHSTWGINRNLETNVSYFPKLKKELVAKVVHACLEQCRFNKSGWINSDFLHMELQPINKDNRNQHLWFDLSDLMEIAAQLNRIGLVLDVGEPNFKKLAAVVVAATRKKTFKFVKQKIGESNQKDWFPVELYNHQIKTKEKGK